MKSIDILIIAVIITIVGFCIWYIRKSKKRGKKCIGCPDSCACSGYNCSGGCRNCQKQ